jgi:hypothetical protein
MAVKYTLVHSDTTSTPNDSAAATFSFGDNIPGGPIDSIVVRMTATVATGSVVADYSNMISALRFTLNGEVVHDFRAGYSGGSNNAPGLYGYFLNSIGGRFSERPSDTAKEAYFVIPVGRQVAAGVSRLETVLTYGILAGAASASTLQIWLKYNDAMQTTTTVAPSTSFTHAASLEQVVVRIPQNLPGTVAGILVQNDSAADELGTQGIRLNAMGDYGLDADMHRLFNGDLYNGVLYADDDVSTTALQYAVAVNGGLFIPTYGLSGGDVILQVDSSAATTRTYTPVITAAVGAKEVEQTKQTQAAPTNTAASILRRTEE